MVVRDLLVAPRQAEHGLVVEVRRHVLDRLEDEAVRLGLIDQRLDVLVLPGGLARQARVVHLDALDADLRREAQLLLGQFVELADRDADAFIAHVEPLLRLACYSNPVIPSPNRRSYPEP